MINNVYFKQKTSGCPCNIFIRLLIDDLMLFIFCTDGIFYISSLYLYGTSVCRITGYYHDVCPEEFINIEYIESRNKVFVFTCNLVPLFFLLLYNYCFD